MKSRVTARLSVAAAVVLAGLTVAGPAVAAEGKASDVRVSRDGISVVFEATGTESTIDPGSVTLDLNGAPIPAQAELFDKSGASLTRTTMLVFDTSGSMNNEGRLEGAKEAARAFIESVPDDVQVGLVTFDSDAELVQAPTDDREALGTAVDGLQAAGSTAMYDGVQLAAQTLGKSGVRSIVLLSDGNEKGSQATLDEATSLVKEQKISLDAVAFQTTAGGEELDDLAQAGGGRVLTSADSAELLTTFQAAAEQISRQLVVTADVPEDSATGQVTLQLAGQVDDETVTASALGFIRPESVPPSPIDSSPKAAAISQGPWMESWFVWLAVGVFFLGVLGVFAFALNAAVPTKKIGVSKQLSVYTLNRGKAKEQRRERTVFGESSIAQNAVDFAGRLTAKRGLEESLQRRLDASGLPLKPAEWILIQAGVLILVPVLAFALSGGSLVLTIVAVVVAAVGPFVFLSVKESRRRNAFVESLPDTLQLMAGSLSAGYSLPQAVDSVVRDGQGPIATEFNRALVETRLGVPIEDSLEAIADRMRSKDWAWVVMAIRVQREVGGNLAELLLTVAATLRDRARIRRQIQTLSAEGRLSAWILGGLPIVFALYLLTSRPSYILALTEEPLGWLMIASGVILMVVGGLWMKKIVDVEV